MQTYSGSGGFFLGAGSSSSTTLTTVRLVREGPAWRISVPPDDYLLLNTKP